jgi:hypothetical protein
VILFTAGFLHKLKKGYKERNGAGCFCAIVGHKMLDVYLYNWASQSCASF